MGRRARALTAVAAVALLTGCSTAAATPGADAPVTDLSTSVAPPAPTPTGQPAPGAPPLPAVAAVQDRAGATAFVHHWFDLLNAAYVSGDATALEQASTAECVFCRGVIEGVEAEAQAQEAREGGAVSVIDVAVPPGEPGQIQFLVNGAIAQSAGRVLGADGVVVAPIGKIDTGVITALVVWQAGRWQLDELALTVKS